MSNHEHSDPQDAAGESALQQAWQQVSDERPPPELDAAIIAAARRSVQDRGTAVTKSTDRGRSRSWLMQWQPLAAAATVAGLAFILLQVMPREREVTPSIRLEDSRPAAAEPAAESADRDAATLEPAGSASVPSDQRQVIPPDSTNAKAITPAPARAGSTNAVPDVSADADRRSTVLSQRNESGALAAAAQPQVEKRQRSNSPQTTADWAAAIVALYESGDLAGAADSLRAFREADPDADTYLPESLRDWARTVN